MCQVCQSDQVPPEPRLRLRRKLWEIDTHCHCTIIGTCLSLPELRGIASRNGLELAKPNPTEYEIHSAMVHLASRDRSLGKALHKALDRKYALSIKRFSRVTNRDAVETLWKECLGRGEVAGPLWALMTHPATDDSLQSLVFGEIHMLSHQVGSMVRADMRQMAGLEKEKAELNSKIKRQQERLHHEIASRDTALRDLLALEQAENRRLRECGDTTEQIRSLKVIQQDLQQALDLAENRARKAEDRTRIAEEIIGDLDRSLTEQTTELTALRAEVETLEARLNEALPGGRDRPSCPAPCNRPDLCGRCILYVGGRSVQVPHLQKLVSERNGILIHHDGGVEDNIGRLQGLLGNADAVMFPVDCVSHAAHDQLKKLCRRWSKPFVPVRRSGLGAFIAALDTLSSPTPS
ncbi:DUF2325 domain-containing protein [Magnetospirillum molischianum]|uniref:DUF2325 domain-containing protein n=1 Tax=Magnetospirillum molischianum DSM 120 TaxID=1150626 RepID=H8FVK6_MAGML|nr:DUF2325 domain-containing protein [Magnetospirillum molischianum]CCG42394.1 conserved hypothetical protein [Magnetospirillum molischianum DSM 120]